MPVAPLVWPTKGPNETLNYQLDATTQIAAANDTAVSASVSVAPSGPGEMTATAISMAGSFVTVWLSGGQPGRVYQVVIIITTAAGETYQFPIVLPIDASLAVYPITPPANPGFGTPINWP